MNGIELNNLITRAKPYLGKKIKVSLKGGENPIEFTFTDISDSFSLVERGREEDYSVYGKLIDNDGHVLSESLSKLVSFFEAEDKKML